MIEEISDKFSLPTQGLVVVDFAAEWCSPCKVMYPILEVLSEKYTDVKFLKLDVSKHIDVATQYRVLNIPCLVVFKDGKEIDRMVGFSGKTSVEDLFYKHV